MYHCTTGLEYFMYHFTSGLEPCLTKCCVAAGWARYVLTWQMHLTDSKVRPSGSPGRDTSMADLLGCQFPEHSTDCKFASKAQLPEPLLS